MKYYFLALLIIGTGIGFYYNKDYSVFVGSDSISSHQDPHLFYLKLNDGNTKIAAIKNHIKLSVDELNSIQNKLKFSKQIQLTAKESDIGSDGEILVTIWADGVKLN